MIDGAFKVSGGMGGGLVWATVGLGTVNGYEPKISGAPISESPRISGSAEFDGYGRVYVCLQVKISSLGKMEPDGLTIVISNLLRAGASENTGLPMPLYWNHPIAVFSDQGDFAQIVYFDLLHYTAQRGTSFGDKSLLLWYHYFSVA
jgi:hypothetical protein